MPQQTYSIGFGQNDFFYSDTSQNNLLQTIPFNITNLKAWCTKFSSINITSPSPSIVFNSEISKIIIDNSQNFINTYMPGNIRINNNFNNIALGLTATGQSGVQPNSVTIGGTADIGTHNSSIPNLKLDISAGKIDYSTQGGQWQNDITLDASIHDKSPYLPIQEILVVNSSIIVPKTMPIILNAPHKPLPTLLVKVIANVFVQVPR